MVIQLLLAMAPLIDDTLMWEKILSLEARLGQFPSRAVASVGVDVSKEHLRWLKDVRSVIPGHRRDTFAAQFGAAERFHQTWFILYLARCRVDTAKDLMNESRKHSGNYRKLEDLIAAAKSWIDTLESWLGDDDFRAGRMPLPVPYWYIPSIN